MYHARRCSYVADIVTSDKANCSSEVQACDNETCQFASHTLRWWCSSVMQISRLLLLDKIWSPIAATNSEQSPANLDNESRSMTACLSCSIFRCYKNTTETILEYCTIAALWPFPPNRVHEIVHRSALAPPYIGDPKRFAYHNLTTVLCSSYCNN